MIAPPSLFLERCKTNFREDIATCSQDITVTPGFGAFTGELSAAMLLDSGIKWTLAGHSERRVGFGYPVSCFLANLIYLFNLVFDYREKVTMSLDEKSKLLCALV